jgi:hypothetical protein
MKKTAIAFLVGMFALGAAYAPPAGAASVLLDYVGFDYESPNPDPTQFGELASGYTALGEVPVLFAPLVYDQANNEYTFVMTGLVSISRQVVGPFIIVDYSPGVFNAYEDSKTLGTGFDYGVNPPNATAPSSFNDGTLYLSGPVTNFRLVFNTVDNSGSYEGVFNATGGSQLANIPPGNRAGWTFAGITSNALNIPAGYAHQVDGQIILEQVVPAEPKSWGRLKADYR